MSRHNEIQNAYRSLGKEATFYDGMITCSTLPGRVICGLVWNMGQEKNTRYLEKALDRIPDGFSGKLLEVPVGTGVLTIPVYKTLPKADITCLDYSPDMMVTAQRRAKVAGLKNVTFQQEMWAPYRLGTAHLTWCCPSMGSTLSLTKRLHTMRFTGFSVRAEYSAAAFM